MRKLLFTSFLILYSLCLHAQQYVKIPDLNFKNYLKQKYPSCFNGNMMDANCEDIKNAISLNVRSNNIMDLEGIQYFLNLDSLECGENSLINLPLLPPSLQVLSCYQNSLINLPDLPPSLRVLICYNNALTSLPTLPDSLQYLICSMNTLTSLPNLPSTLVELNCFNNPLSGLPPLGGSLIKLNCSANGLTDLPNLPASLEELICSSNFLASMPDGPISLQYLDCSINKLTSLPSLPNSLSHLNCSSNLLANISSLPPLLKELNCSYNLLNHLPVLPLTLRHLDCYFNTLVSLPVLPKSLQHLGCSFNGLKSLSTLPDSLEVLYCSNDSLIDLPPLPNSLIKLDCSHNSLSHLSNLSSSLMELNCSFNPLGTLPVLPSSLEELNCSYSLLNRLPDLPDSLKVLDCSGNSLIVLATLPKNLLKLFCSANNLNCLPYLPSGLSLLNIDAEKIFCIPNKPQGLRITNIEGDPIGKLQCNPTNNVNQCEALPLISGRVYQDTNLNGIMDSNELGRVGVKISLSDSNFTFSDLNGYYEIASPSEGNMMLSVQSPQYYTAFPSFRNFNMVRNGEQIVQDIALQVKNPVSELSLTLTPISAARPGFRFSYQIDYQNTGTTSLNPVLILDFEAERLTFDSVSVHNPHTVNGGTFTLDLKSKPILPGDRKTLIVYFTINPMTPIGDTILADLKASYEAANESPIVHAYVIVRGSYDPNDKKATPVLTPTQVADGVYIDYTIRFQNTGTDTAFTIVVADTLPGNLQITTMELISTSHPCSVVTNGSVVYFEFKNILLPDSNINEQASHGYVRFKVKPIKTLGLGDQIDNKAHIYFDYNAAVVTNIASTFIKESGGIIAVIADGASSEASFVYPNPSNSKIYVSGVEHALLKISNIYGQVVLEQIIDKSEAIDVSGLDKGCYVYQIDQRTTGKLMIE